MPFVAIIDELPYLSRHLLVLGPQRHVLPDLLLQVHAKGRHLGIIVLLLDPQFQQRLFAFLQCSFELEAGSPEELQFRCEFHAVLVSFDFDVDVAVGLLSEDEVVAHFFHHVHEGVDEVVLLLALVLLVQLVQNQQALVNRCMQLVYVASVNHRRLHQFPLHLIIILSPSTSLPQQPIIRSQCYQDQSWEAVGLSCAKGRYQKSQSQFLSIITSLRGRGVHYEILKLVLEQHRINRILELGLHHLLPLPLPLPPRSTHLFKLLLLQRLPPRQLAHRAHCHRLPLSRRPHPPQSLLGRPRHRQRRKGGYLRAGKSGIGKRGSEWLWEKRVKLHCLLLAKERVWHYRTRVTVAKAPFWHSRHRYQKTTPKIDYAIVQKTEHSLQNQSHLISPKTSISPVKRWVNQREIQFGDVC